MSSHIKFYIGPYIMVRNVPGVPIEIDRRTCSNSQCTVYDRCAGTNDTFCNQCGSAIRMRKMTKMQRIDLHDVFQKEFDNCDQFFTLNRGAGCVVLPNNHSQGGLTLGEEDNGETMIGPDAIESLKTYDLTDWIRLEAVLMSKGIEHARQFGIVTYWI